MYNKRIRLKIAKEKTRLSRLLYNNSEYSQQYITQRAALDSRLQQRATSSFRAKKKSHSDTSPNLIMALITVLTLERKPKKIPPKRFL